MSGDTRDTARTMRKVSEILRGEMSRWIVGDHDLRSCITVPQTPTPKLSVSKINHPWSDFSSDLYRRLFLLPRPLVHFWKGVPPYGGSHYLRHDISISISCGNSFRNLPGPRALSYYGVMRDVIRITLNRAIQFAAADLMALPCQLKDRAFARPTRMHSHTRTHTHTHRKLDDVWGKILISGSLRGISSSRETSSSLITVIMIKGVIISIIIV